MSSSASDSSEPVIVSHPSSPTRMTSLSPSAAAPHQVEPITVKDTPSEHVSALSPTEPQEQTRGIGQTGAAQLDRLNTASVLGGTEAVVGPAHGEAPEYIATLKRHNTDGTINDGEESGNDDGTSRGGGPKWLKKVKDGVSSIKEKAAASSASTRERSDTGSITGGSLFSRDRSQTNASRNSPITSDRIITDEHGNPVPVEVGVVEPAPRPIVGKTVKQGDFARPGNASVADSTGTSVKDKVLETFEVEPRTSQEKFHSMFKDISNREELIEGEHPSTSFQLVD